MSDFIKLVIAYYGIILGVCGIVSIVLGDSFPIMVGLILVFFVHPSNNEKEEKKNAKKSKTGNRKA